MMSLYLLLGLCAIAAAIQGTGTDHLQGTPTGRHGYVLDNHPRDMALNGIHDNSELIAAKREELVTPVATRTHYRGHGSPVPISRGSPRPNTQESANPLQLASEIISILDQFDHGDIKTTNEAIEFPQATPSTLVKRAPNIASAQLHSPDSLIHNAASFLADTTAGTNSNDIATKQQSLESEHEHFFCRRQTLSARVMEAISERSLKKGLDLISQIVGGSSARKTHCVSTKEHSGLRRDTAFKPT